MTKPVYSMAQASRSSRKRKMPALWRYREDYLFMLPYLILFVLFTVVPVIASVGLSMTYFNVLESPRFIGLDNYLRLFLDDTLFVKALMNTLILSVITGPVGFLLCFIMAWVLNELPARIRAVLTLMLYAPSISGNVYLIWTIIYSGDSYGLLNAILMNLKILYEPKQWLTDSSLMLPAAIVVILWMSLGTSFLSFIAGFQNVDTKLYEAAAVDGIRNRWQELWYITLPSMRSMLLFSAVMQIAASYSVGAVAKELAGYPSVNNTVDTIIAHLGEVGTVRYEYGYAAAISVFLFALMALTRLIIDRALNAAGR